MNPLPFRLLAAAVVGAFLVSPALAQERERARSRRPQEQSASAPAPVRQAQPRSRAPQAQAPPTSSAPRESERREPARAAGVERARGADNEGRVRAPQQERAVPRSATPPPARVERNEPSSNAGTGSTAAVADAGDEQRRAQPRGSRPRGDNPTVGRAEPRDGRWYGGDRDRNDGRRNDTWRGTSIYRGYYSPRFHSSFYYPRRWYPYGYGAFGLGYFYYDPYTWYGYDPYYHYPRYSYYGGGYYGGGQGYYTGELRLRVHPRHAEVYVDGYFAGHVDDFDGTFQALRLEEGPYRIEIVAPGYETLEFDIRIQPGRKVTYRGELRPRP
jgi:hypothetical protein